MSSDEIVSRIQLSDNGKILARNISNFIKEKNISKEHPDKLGWELSKKILTTQKIPTEELLVRVIQEDLINKKDTNEEDMIPTEDQQKVVDDKNLSKNQKIKELTKMGASVGMISKALNLSYQRVRNIAKNTQYEGNN